MNSESESERMGSEMHMRGSKGKTFFSSTVHREKEMACWKNCTHNKRRVVGEEKNTRGKLTIRYTIRFSLR